MGSTSSGKYLVDKIDGWVRFRHVKWLFTCSSWRIIRLVTNQSSLAWKCVTDPSSNYFIAFAVILVAESMTLPFGKSTAHASKREWGSNNEKWARQFWPLILPNLSTFPLLFAPHYSRIPIKRAVFFVYLTRAVDLTPKVSELSQNHQMFFSVFDVLHRTKNAPVYHSLLVSTFFTQTFD